MTRVTVQRVLQRRLPESAGSLTGRRIGWFAELRHCSGICSGNYRLSCRSRSNVYSNNQHSASALRNIKPLNSEEFFS